MHILEVVEPGMNGVYKHVEGLSRFLLRNGVLVSLAYSDRRACDALYGLVDDVIGAGGAALNLRVGPAPEPLDISAIARLHCLLRRVKIDVVHAHSSKAGGVARLLALLNDARPVIYTPHAYYGLNRTQGLKNRVFNFIESMLARVGYSVHVSRSEHEFALGRLGIRPARATIIPNGVDCDIFAPASEAVRVRIRRYWGIPEGALVVGTVGRYSSQKDPVTLYLAIRAFLKRNPSAWFVHVGNGEQFERITQDISSWPERDRIIRVPYLNTPHEAYQMMDVFVLTSLYEGLALSVLEAGATGLPMVLSRCPGNSDFEEYGLNTIEYARPADASDFAVALERVFRSGMVNNHREIILSRFSHNVSYGRVLDMYRDVLSNCGGGLQL